MDAVPGRSSDNEIRFTRKEIFGMVKGHLNNDLSIIIEHLEEQLNRKTGYSIQINDSGMKSALSKLFHTMRNKWHEVKRTEEKFFKKFEAWLEVSVAFRIRETSSETKDKDGRGRPCLQFSQSSEGSKRRKTEDIRANFSAKSLCYATHMTLRASGKVEASKLIKTLTSASPSRAIKYRKALEFRSESMLSDDAALSLLVEQKLSNNQYLGLRAVSKENKCNLYPPYKKVLKAKQQCYPDEADILITEYSAEVKLQALLNKTMTRILLLQSEIIKSLTPQTVKNLTLICKWGCDGSSGQSVYKQRFSDDTKSDSDIFLTSLVPLQLIPSADGTTIVWKNPRHSSPRFCRPIRLQFIHEDTQVIQKEVAYIEEQIRTLVPFNTVLDGKEICITYKLALTMKDGKVCNAISSTQSAQRCYLCGATSTQFNDIENILNKEAVQDNLRFGLSTLHAWIRFFECCLHLSYKLEIKKWQARGKVDKEKVEKRKKIIQRDFRVQLGLIVDRPKPGFASTNDGNTARRFFENSKVSSLITGIDEKIINRFHTILQTILSGHAIDPEKFHEYAIQTARKYIELYPWYYMPTSVHKILIHGPQIITSAILPIGQMSEDAQEALNKYIKRFREDFARKCSRTKTIQDVFLRLLVTSDPYISNIRKLPQKSTKRLCSDAVELLVPPAITVQQGSDVDEETDDTDENSDKENAFP